MLKPRIVGSLGLRWLGLAALALPATAKPQPAPVLEETVVIIGSGTEQRLFDTPYAVGVVDAAELRSAGPMVNLSEALARVPGLVVNLRNNYAQDLQISSRGFGARASFGVRGMRLYTDGIPAAGPDGQGQVSHFDLAGAERVEVLRGPFSALYGNGSGGVISLLSAAPVERAVSVSVDAGSAGLAQVRLGIDAPLEGGFSVRASVSGFEIDGFRPHSAAQRRLGNVRLGYEGKADRVVVVLNALDQPAQDPLGLTRAQFEADPDQTTPQAMQFDTRKEASQAQGGVQWRHRFSGGGALRESQLTAYYGQRSVTQWQSIPVATQVNPVNPAISERQPGGVIDFDRDYAGVDARGVWRWALAGDRAAQLVAGGTFDESRENRRGFENFTGSGADQVLGVTGDLRRDETNRIQAGSVYAQGEIEFHPRWVATLGVRSGRVEFRSDDHYIKGSNLDDSGSQSYRFTNPVAALQWRASEALNLYVSAGRGYESPTFNELAYRPDGSAGFNTELKGQSSTQLELGAKWRAAALGLSLDAAIFEARTQDEIGVATNRGGRATFTNVDDTKRQGAEIDLRWRIAPAWRAQLAATWLSATYVNGFFVCRAVPCLTPDVPVPAGNRIAGTVDRSAYAELAWTPGAFEFGLEARGQGRQAVNDTNSDFAAGYGLLGLRALWRLDLGPGQLELLGRIDNLADRRVAGSVIVNEANQRFFEPAAGRNFLASARWSQRF
ncbi:MAG: TonB-dependent receptor [Rubrivivax sp.]|nr:TonB-dependent receptor [Rubrivivax sp.]